MAREDLTPKKMNSQYFYSFLVGREFYFEKLAKGHILKLRLGLILSKFQSKFVKKNFAKICFFVHMRSRAPLFFRGGRCTYIVFHQFRQTEFSIMIGF
jgi:hypothetical protein